MRTTGHATLAGMSMTTVDIIVLGAGMAGASIAAELAPHRRVAILEVEDQPGRHATGRSAAMFFESYGNATVRALTRCSRAFLQAPPPGFAQVPLMTPRAAMFVAGPERIGALQALLDAAAGTPGARRLGTAEALARVPILRGERVAGAVLDETGCDMDVAAIHQGYLRQARQAGAQLVLDGGEVTLAHHAGLWQVSSRAGMLAAPVIVNATGAWAEEVARQAGVAPVGLQPMRRTALLLPLPEAIDARAWPLTIDIDETLYFKPDAGHLLLSPANEDPMPACDVAPEEIDIAVAVDRFEALTTLPVQRIVRRWAGLRSFVADRSPVAGFDARAEGFFWLAGQGGYGIQMAPALARAAAALVLGRPLPQDIEAQDVTPGDLSPARAALQGGPAHAGAGETR
jgi:D-arginine dehydrogenase